MTEEEIMQKMDELTAHVKDAFNELYEFLHELEKAELDENTMYKVVGRMMALQLAVQAMQ